MSAMRAGEPFVPPFVPPPNSSGRRAGEDDFEPGEDTSAEFDALAQIRATLESYGIDNPAIANRAWELIKQGFDDSPAYIMQQLREMPEYQAYFPELKMRADTGKTFMSEGQILAWRSTAQELARTYYGKTLTVQEMANAVANDISPAELKHRFEVLDNVKTRGGPLKEFFSQNLGINLDDEDLAEFLDPEVNTADLDRVFEEGMYRAAPAVFFGNNLLPENLTNQLRAFGLDPGEAFQRYEQIGGQLTNVQRLMHVDPMFEGVNITGNDLFNEVPFQTLNRAIMFGDSQALLQLQGVLAREVAKHTQKGGAAAGGKGLLGKEERRRLT